MRPVPQIALDFIKGAEACRLTAYQDSAGIWTIGWGHTGPEVVQGMTITLAQALAYLMADVGVAARRLAAVVKAEEIAALTDHEYAALLSFVFNLGAKNSWTIWKLLNAGNLAAAQNELIRFDKAQVKGQLVEIDGLKHRRLAETALWATPDVASALAIVAAAPVAAPPSSQTRDMDTPPTPAGTAKGNAASKSFIASCVAGVCYVGDKVVPYVQSTIKTVNGALGDFVGQSEVLQHLQSELAIAGFAAVLAVPALVALKNWQAKHQ